MKKQDLIKAIAADAKISIDAATKCMNSLTNIVTEELKKGEEVNITGFGAWKVSTRAARKGVNPKTRTPITIPATKTPVFRAGKTLKDSIK